MRVYVRSLWFYDCGICCGRKFGCVRVLYWCFDECLIVIVLDTALLDLKLGLLVYRMLFTDWGFACLRGLVVLCI